MNKAKEVLQLHVSHHRLDDASLESIVETLSVYDQETYMQNFNKRIIRTQTTNFQAKQDPESRDTHHRAAYIAWSMGGQVAGEDVPANRK